ncbi:MAG: Clp protease N-terminal domain-containing protein [Acidimicrobiales bacterium]
MDEPYDDLDDTARRALEVALAAAAAIGDQQCGTEYLLYGLFAGVRGDMAEIAELFVLDALRVERAIQKIREPFTYTSNDYDGDPQLTARALAALHTSRHDGSGPTGVFEILYGVLSDPRSGACAVLRELGVRPEEVHRLAAYGRRHLSKDEAALLLQALDRRDLDRHRPWWGPLPDATLTPCSFGAAASVEVARSVTAVASVADLAANQHGFVITLKVESSRPWVLPPVVDPPEILVPGFAATRRHGPEILRFELVFADGSKVSNMNPIDRWRSERPNGPALVPLSTHWETSRPNDRRGCEHRRVLAQWWIWPLPVPGTVEVRVDWPAEVLSGLAPFDARPLVKAASALQFDPAQNPC